MSVLSELARHDAAPEGVLDVPWRAEGESKEYEAARAHIVLDWVVRVYTPAFLRLVPALVTHADKLETKAGISRAGRVRGEKLIDAAMNAAQNAARNADWDAAGVAARNAARDAAGDAAWNAAGVAVRDAAWGAAGSAAWSAAWNAAWNAAWSAAWNAARDAARNAGSAAKEVLAPAVQHTRSTYPNLIGIVATAGWLSDAEQAAVSQWIPGGCLALWFRGSEAAKYEAARAMQVTI